MKIKYFIKKLASRDPREAFVEDAWHTVGGNGAISENNWNVL